jgi:hypothetical protein
MHLLPSATGKDAMSAPPCYPDKIHVSNGCHLSTVRYLAQFKSDYPDEQGEVLEISLPDACRNHSVALVTWHGRLWCRDEYVGVFPLECRAEPRPKPEVLVEWTEYLFRQQAARLIQRDGAANTHFTRGPMSKEQRLAEVARAEQIIPFRTTVFWIRCKNQEIPVIFFAPRVSALQCTIRRSAPA